MIVIAVDLLFIVPGVVGGSEDYSTALLRSFAAHGPADVELRLFAQTALKQAHPDLAESFEFETVDLRGGNKIARVIAESTWFERSARRHCFDAQHHFGGRLPARSSGRQILTLHDLQPLDQPQNFGFAKRQFLARAIPRSVRRANKIVAVSELVREQIIERFAVPPANVVTVASGLGPARANTADVAAELPDDYVLYPAVTHPHKNHRVLLEAIALLRDRGVHKHLVLVGGAGAARSEVDDLIRRFDLSSLVLHLGRVERASVDALLARATAMAFPTLYEGFGLPVLEALRLRTPVIASDIEPIRTIAGEAVTLVDPTSASAWAAAIASPSAFPGDRADEVLRRFSPESRAVLLAETYRSVASDSHGGR